MENEGRRRGDVGVGAVHVTGDRFDRHDRGGRGHETGRLICEVRGWQRDATFELAGLTVDAPFEGPGPGGDRLPEFGDARRRDEFVVEGRDRVTVRERRRGSHCERDRRERSEREHRDRESSLCPLEHHLISRGPLTPVRVMPTGQQPSVAQFWARLKPCFHHPSDRTCPRRWGLISRSRVVCDVADRCCGWCDPT